MHLIMILAAISVAWLVRTRWNCLNNPNWTQRWRQALFLFLFPPLMVFMTTIAVLCMGTQGKMGNWQAGSLGYGFALSYLAISAIFLIKLAYQGWQTVNSARNYPLVEVADKQVRLLNTKTLFAGQIGFWHPELVVSQGMIETLDENHLHSVLAHEQGHYIYRDTFWFFWLGWVRSCSAWLPNTNTLWQELLVLRELRADAHAALQVDPLVLAESLLMVVSSQSLSSDIVCAAVDSCGNNRLEQRIEAILSPQQTSTEVDNQPWNLLLAFLPLIAVMFHT
ncbi:MAG: M56 family metallopeptidase [Scytonematopsis contorta HA4267-MV1]|nr:M56 family metallopeptidase [Scytonematopsis contorta HA4267-MV1]